MGVLTTGKMPEKRNRRFKQPKKLVTNFINDELFVKPSDLGKDQEENKEDDKMELTQIEGGNFIPQAKR